jgi:hypothetical protein
VELLRRVAVDVDDLDVDGGEPGEVQRVGQRQRVCGVELVCARRDVEFDRPESTAGEMYVDRDPPRQVPAVFIAGERLDESVSQLGGVDVGVAEAEVEILREPGRIT